MVAERIKNKIISELIEEIPELDLGVNLSFSLNQHKSKKNFVYDLLFEKKPKNFPKEFVLKIFRTDNAENEYETYKKKDFQNG